MSLETIISLIARTKDLSSLVTKLVVIGVSVLVLRTLNRGMDAIEKFPELSRSVDSMAGSVDIMQKDLSELNNKMAVVVTNQGNHKEEIKENKRKIEVNEGMIRELYKQKD